MVLGVSTATNSEVVGSNPRFASFFYRVTILTRKRSHAEEGFRVERMRMIGI